MIDSGSIINRNSENIESKVDQEVVILGIDQGSYVGLNKMGTIIWEMINTHVKVIDLIKAMQDLYDEDPGIIREQVLDFLNELYNRKLINESGET